MGDFIGHIDEATVFLIVSLWWMYKGFTNHIKASSGNGRYVIEVSYFSNIRGRQIPLEQILKIVFPIISLAGELIGSKLKFSDENGQALMKGVNYLMHASILGVFVLHGIIDWLQKKGYKFIPPKLNIISLAFAFLWYTLGIYYHAQMETKDVVENALHSQATVPLSIICLVMFLISVWPSTFFLDFIRCYCLFLLGTWVVHTSFILYKPSLTPGGAVDNPAWNREYTGNVAYIKVLFGLHLGFDLAFTVFFYALCYWLITCRHAKKSDKFMSCPSTLEDTESMEKLLQNDAFQAA